MYVAVGQLHRVAMHATVAREQVAALIQLRRSRQRPAVALAARRLDVLRRQNRLLPRQRAVMRLRNGGGRTLSAMADHASKLIELMRNHGMRAERLLAHVGEAGLVQSEVAGGAAVDDAEFRQPDLLNAAWKCRCSVTASLRFADQPQVAVLIVAPLAEVILGGRDRQREQQQNRLTTPKARTVSPNNCLPQRRKVFLS